MEITMLGLLLKMFFFISVAAVLECPKIVYVELGKSGMINCSLANIDSVYWYYKNGTDAKLIVKLAYGEKYVSGDSAGYFDISRDGALIISDMQHRHSGVYMILHIHSDDSSDRVDTQLEFAVRPQESCPKISNCSTCDGCISQTSNSGELSCSVLATRPHVNISFRLDKNYGFRITGNDSNVVYNEATDTWDSYTMITYSADTCGSVLSIYCVVGGVNRFTIPSSYVTVNTEQCLTSSPTTLLGENNDVPIPVLSGIIGLLVGALFIIFAIVISVLLYRKKHRPKKRKTHEEKHTVVRTSTLDTSSKGIEENRQTKLEVHEMENVSETSPMLDPASKCMEDKRERLVNYLNDKYQLMEFIKPLPWVESIEIDRLYTGCEFVITKQGKSSIMSSIEFLQKDVCGKLRRALIIAELGHGKTTFIQHLSFHWSKKTLNEFKGHILFILPLNEVNVNTGVAAAIHKTIPQDLPIEPEDICYVLKHKKCLLLLDGLDELLALAKQSAPDDKRVTTKNDIELKRLLMEPAMSAYPYLTLWVTSRKTNESDELFSKPYVKVNLKGFSDGQINEYIEKTCEYYMSIATRADISTDCKQGSKDGIEIAVEITNESEENEKNSLFKSKTVKEANNKLKNNDIISDFRSHPVLLVMFIHIIVSKLCGIKESISSINIEKLSSLISAVISCLQKRHLEKENNRATVSDIKDLEIKLSKIALDEKEELQSSWKLTDLIDKKLKQHEFDLALSVGLLKLSQPSSNSAHGIESLAFSDYTDVVFFHHFMQEFLVAKHITKLKCNIESMITRSSSNDRIKRVCMFICGLDDELGLEILTSLAKAKSWDAFIDCLYESRKEESVESMKSKWGSKLMSFLGKHPDVNISSLDSTYHMNALGTFCQRCLTSKITLNKLSLHGTFITKNLDRMMPPMMSELSIIEHDDCQENFYHFLNFACKQDNFKKLGFLNCSLPDKVDAGKLRKVTFTINKIEVTKESGKKCRTLDTKTGLWEKRNDDADREIVSDQLGFFNGDAI